MDTALGLTALLIFSAAVFSTLAIALVWEVVRDWLRRRNVQKRLDPIIAQMDDADVKRSDDIVRKFSGDEGGLTDFVLSIPGVQGTQTLLEEARVDWRPEALFLICAGLAVGLGAATFIVSSLLLVAILAAAIGAWLPFFYLRRRKAKRIHGFEEQFPESIDLLTRAIRAGHPLATGVGMVASEGPPIVAEEFRQTFEEHRFGLPFTDALLGLVDRMNIIDVRIFAISVLIQREVGGNLAEILETLADTVRKRFYIRRQIRVYTAQGRLSGYALATLPLAVAFFTWLGQPEYMSLLITTALGRILITIAIVLQFIGLLWIRKIINIDI